MDKPKKLATMGYNQSRRHKERFQSSENDTAFIQPDEPTSKHEHSMQYNERSLSLPVSTRSADEETLLRYDRPGSGTSDLLHVDETVHSFAQQLQSASSGRPYSQDLRRTTLGGDPSYFRPPTRCFNEDVADRNLDVQYLQDIAYVNEPPAMYSKAPNAILINTGEKRFSEDVADRNMTTGKESLDLAASPTGPFPTRDRRESSGSRGRILHAPIMFEPVFERNSEEKCSVGSKSPKSARSSSMSNDPLMPRCKETSRRISNLAHYPSDELRPALCSESTGSDSLGLIKSKRSDVSVASSMESFASATSKCAVKDDLNPSAEIKDVAGSPEHCGEQVNPRGDSAATTKVPRPGTRAHVAQANSQRLEDDSNLEKESSLHPVVDELEVTVRRRPNIMPGQVRTINSCFAEPILT
jgi:hypothetical protein